MAWLEPAIVRREPRALVVARTIDTHVVRLRTELVTAFDEDWVLLLSPIVEERRAFLRDALEFNSRLAIGALAIEQGWLVLRATHLLANLDAQLLDRHIAFVARETLRLRTCVTRELGSSGTTFAHLLD